ncbi:hypothetical protein Q7P37_001424 [Cladosporium fusiforme]
MAAQQIQIAETIRAMKLALKRRPDGTSQSEATPRTTSLTHSLTDAEDDDATPTHTNRGKKLKRRAQFAREGRLDSSGGLSYRKQVNHAGYTRTTISTNPPLFDSDGEPASPTSSDNEHERHLQPIEDDPFGDVQLEHLLRPLAAAHELVDHPSLSGAYKSKALTQMANEAAEMLRRERETLWKAKRLLRRFRGEADWAPLEKFETEGDEMLLHDHPAGGVTNGNASAVPSITMSMDDAPVATQEAQTGEALPNGITEGPVQPEEHAENGVHTADMATESTSGPRELQPSQPDTNTQPLPADAPPNPSEETPRDPDTTMAEPTDTDNPNPAAEHPALASLRQSPSAGDSEQETPGGHIMTTRARARSPASPASSPTPSDSASIPPIHPWFTAPTTSIPSSDLSLPTTEAEETRKLLLLYCQKQEQTIRSLEGLAFGLQKADRLRKFVYESAKASGHLVDDGKGHLVTEMSDGEDWYDPEEWGLGARELGGLEVAEGGVLEKGKDEVEEPEEEGRKGIRRRRVTRVV